MHDPGDPGLRGPAAIVAAERHRALRLAVERAPLREDLVPLGDETRDLDRVLVRLAASGGEDSIREVVRRDFSEKAGVRGETVVAGVRGQVDESGGLDVV